LPSVEEVLGASGRPTHRDGPAQPGQPQAHGGILTRPQTQAEGTGGAMAAQAGATLPPVPMAPVPTLGRLGEFAWTVAVAVAPGLGLVVREEHNGGRFQVFASATGPLY
jgi:hypothetical protein